MGSKGDRQDVLAGVGVNRVPPGFARPGHDSGDPLLDRAAPANPVDVRRGKPVAASMGRSTAHHWRRSRAVPFQGFDAKRRLSSEAAIERSTSSSAAAVKRHRRDLPASRPPCRPEPEAPNRLKAGGCLLTAAAEYPVGLSPVIFFQITGESP